MPGCCSLQPTHAEAALYLGILQAQQGEEAAAESSYTKALEAQPDLAEAQYHLALLYKKATKTPARLSTS